MKRDFYLEQDFLHLKKRRGICIGYSIASLALGLVFALLLLIFLKRENKALILAFQIVLFSLGGFAFLTLLFLKILPLGKRIRLFDEALHNPAYQIRGRIQSIALPENVNPHLFAKEIIVKSEQGEKALYLDDAFSDLPLPMDQEVTFRVVENLIVGISYE